MGLSLKPASELGFGNVDEGMYQAKFTGYSKPEQGKFGLVTRLKFEILDDEDFQGSVLEQLYGVESKKFFNAVKALAGGEYPEDGGDLDEFVGAIVSISVVNVEKNGDTFSNVGNVSPSRRKRKAQPAPSRRNDPDAFNVDDDDDM